MSTHKLGFSNLSTLVWDYCIVFKMDLDKNAPETVAEKASSYLPSFCKKKEPKTFSKEGKDCDPTPQSKQIIETLHGHMVHTFTYLSVQKDELYCLLTVEESALRSFAERIGFKLEMDPTSLEAFMKGKVSKTSEDDEESDGEDHETIAELCAAACGGCCKSSGSNRNSGSDRNSGSNRGGRLKTAFEEVKDFCTSIFALNYDFLQNFRILFCSCKVKQSIAHFVITYIAQLWVFS
jgi:hypothetical protein